MVSQEISKIDAAFWPSPGNITVFAAGTKVDPPGATFGPRRQVSYEFIWVRVGSVAARINRRKIKGSAGTVLLVPAGVTDLYDWSRREKTVHSYIHFFWGPHPNPWPRAGSPVSIGALPPGWPSPASWPLFRNLLPGHTFFQLFRQVLSCYPLGDERFKQLLGPAVEMMLRLYLRGTPDPPQEMDFDSGLSSAVEKILPWLKERVREQPPPKIRLADMARTASVSPSYLCRLFRKDLRIGPMECVRLLKIEYACELLERSQMTIKEVSNLSGFENPFHFSRAFKGIYGLPPKSYREGFLKKIYMRPYSPIFHKYKFAHFFSLNDHPLGFKLMPKKFRTPFSS